MRLMGSVGFATVALLAGCNLLKKEDSDAGTTASPASGLPPECEAFLTRYSCFLKKDGKPTTEADDMRREWTTSAANPGVRPTIVDVCKKQLVTQGPTFDKAGCTSSTAVAAAAASSPTPVAKAAPTNAPAGPKPSACKGSGDCAKGQNCVRWVDGNKCATTCGVGQVCPSGEVCEPTVRLADGSGIIGMCAKAPHNVALGGACKATIDCVAGETCIKGPDGTLCRHFCKSGKCLANEQCGPLEGIEPPDMGLEPREYCVAKKGGAAAPSASASASAASAPGPATCPKGQIRHEGMKTCGAHCFDKPELGPGCPKGFTCSLTSNIDGVCIKQ